MTHADFERRIDAIMDRVDEMTPAERKQKASALRMAALQLNLKPSTTKKVMHIADKLEQYV